MDIDAILPLTFVAFDLETTSQYPDRAQIAEIAAIRFNDGVPDGDTFQTLVFVDGGMPSGAAAVNHISTEMLADAPHMRDAMRMFTNYIGDDSMLVGHNIGTYDIPVMRRVSEQCGIQFNFKGQRDTLTFSKRIWPNLSSHSMDYLRKYLGIDSSGAHRALKDCMDEASLYIAERSAAIKEGVDLSQEPRRPGNASRRRHVASRKPSEMRPEPGVSIDESNPLFGKSVCITGNLALGDREDVWQAVVNRGGTAKDNVIKKLDYLVIGDDPGHAQSSKLATALRYREKGHDIKLITEEQLEELLGLDTGEHVDEQ